MACLSGLSADLGSAGKHRIPGDRPVSNERSCASNGLQAGRIASTGAEHEVMLRPVLGISEPDLERRLLRKGVGELEAHRALCHDCRRSPLVGELLHHFARGLVLCELCRPGHRGELLGSERVAHSERGHTVRLRARPAA